MCTKVVTDPVSVKQPGPHDGTTIKCFIKRDKSTMTYHLFLCLSPDENGKFLLAAKRRRTITCTEFVISMDAENISTSSDTYVGKLRSNFLGNKFIMYDTLPPLNTCGHVPPPGRTNWRFNSKVSPKVPTGNSYAIGQITYEIKQVLRNLGTPRRMHCVMHSIPVSALNPYQLLTTSLDDSCHGGSQFGSLNEEVDTEVKLPLILKSKAPRWHEKLECWCLNFRGRGTVASVKNFQLLADTGSKTVSMISQPSQTDHDKIILQFAKVGKDMFNMDYKYPLSAFQAFAICLSSFDTKLLCQ